MATRTAQGSASSKTSGTALEIPSFTAPAGHSVTVGVVCANAQLAPLTVTHAGRPLRKKREKDNATRAINMSMWIKGEYHKPQTGVLVATWGGAIVERAMVASSWDLAQSFGKGSGRDENTLTTNPGTGKTGSLVTAGAFVVGVEYEINTVGTTDFTLVGAASNTVGLLFVATGVGSGTGDARPALESSSAIAVAYFGSEGPVADHASATARTDDGGVWTAATIGQQAGTSGGGAASNITIVETYLPLTARNPTRAQLQSATSRRWVNVLGTLNPRPTFNNQGITPSDTIRCEQITTDAGGNPEDLVYTLNEDTGLWECYETATPGTLRASRDAAGEWS